jgi:predicted DNA-binding protein (MmcQ/YjbR family)
MDIDWVRQHCLSLAGVTEQIQWEDDLVFKVGGKMFAVVPLEPSDRWLSFKCTPAEFGDLIERPGIIPAPYLARAHWVALESDASLPRAEIERLLSQAHDAVFANLSKKAQAAILKAEPCKTKSRARKS